MDKLKMMSMDKWRTQFFFYIIPHNTPIPLQ